MTKPQEEHSEHKCLEFWYACNWIKSPDKWFCVCDMAKIVKEHRRHRKISKLRRFKEENRSGDES